MKVFVISTPGDKERKTHILNQIKEQEIIDYELIPAIMNSVQPSVGIANSMKKCIKLAKESNLSEVLLLEDDCQFLCPNSYKRLLELNIWITEHTINNLPVDIFLGNVYEGDLFPMNYFVARVDGKLSGLMCMIVKRHFYDKFLQAESPYQIDYWLSEIAHANIYCAHPFLTLQKDGYSYNKKEITNYNKAIGTKYRLCNQS